MKRLRHTGSGIPSREYFYNAACPWQTVADLLGDDEETVRVHYARWVPERQARLTKILQEAFNDKPRPKLVAIK